MRDAGGPEPVPTAGRRLRAVVVGLDHYHVTGWVETLEGFGDELEIVALYDPDAERARLLAPTHHDPALRPSLGDRYRRLPVETDLSVLIERHVPDIALVTLPDRDAPAAIARLARAGVHLLIDKPAARSASEARRAFAAVRASGVRSVVGLTRRYSPSARAARALVGEGRLGPLISAEAVFVASSVRVRDARNRLFDPEQSGGGILRWLGVHDLDTLLWLTGEPVVEVQAMAGCVGLPEGTIEDVISVALRFAGGAIGTVHQAYALPGRGYRTWLAVRGLDASLELRGEEELALFRAGTGAGDPAADDPAADDPRDDLLEEVQRFDVMPTGGYGASGHAAVRDLIDAISDGRDTVATGEALVAAHVLIDAAYASARTGRRVRVAASGGPGGGTA